MDTRLLFRVKNRAAFTCPRLKLSERHPRRSSRETNDEEQEVCTKGLVLATFVASHYYTCSLTNVWAKSRSTLEHPAPWKLLQCSAMTRFTFLVFTRRSVRRVGSSPLALPVQSTSDERSDEPFGTGVRGGRGGGGWVPDTGSLVLRRTPFSMGQPTPSQPPPFLSKPR